MRLAAVLAAVQSRAAAAVLDVGSAGAVLVAGLRMGALPRHPALESLGFGDGLARGRAAASAQECRGW